MKRKHNPYENLIEYVSAVVYQNRKTWHHATANKSERFSVFYMVESLCRYSAKWEIFLLNQDRFEGKTIFHQSEKTYRKTNIWCFVLSPSIKYVSNHVMDGDLIPQSYLAFALCLPAQDRGNNLCSCNCMIVPVTCISHFRAFQRNWISGIL